MALEGAGELVGEVGLVISDNKKSVEAGLLYIHTGVVKGPAKETWQELMASFAILGKTNAHPMDGMSSSTCMWVDCSYLN